MLGTMIMAENQKLRLGTILLLYVAQGIPIGLFWFAIPAWMAANGADAADVGYVLGLTALPWSLKFVNGFIMDRYTILSMGRRRAWLIGAQMLMILVFIIAAIVQPASDEVLLLGMFGLLGNAATTFQDVAADGLAVDLLEEEERGRGSGFMAGGQLLGTAGATAATGWAIANFGASGAYVIAAIAIAAVNLFIVAVRERGGERRLPWSVGNARPENLAVQARAWWPIFKTTLLSLLRPVSLFWVPVMLIKGMQYGVMTGATPLIGAGEAGFAEDEITAISGTAQLVAGILAMTAGGWIADKLGAARATTFLYAAWLAFNGVMTLMYASWSDTQFVYAFIFVWFAIDTVIAAVSFPVCMRLCDPKVAATQFAIYMAMNNIGISLGAALLSQSDRLGGLIALFPIMAGLNIVAIIVLLTVKFPRRQQAVAQKNAAPSPTSP